MARSGRLLSGLMMWVLAGCVGDISDSTADNVGGASGDDDKDGIPDVDTDGDGIPDLDTGSPSQADGDDGSNGDGSGGDGTTGEATDFTYATLGSRCSGGTRQRFVIVSRAAGSCESHAQAADDAASADVLRIPVGEGTSFSGTTQLCEGGSCRDVSVELALGEDGTGTLDADLGGSALERRLAVTNCDYDAVRPPVTDLVARDVTISELALYQVVKVSLSRDGQDVQNRNAPVIAGRDALVRTFVQPQAGFSARELVARLSLDHGDGQPAEVLESRLNVSGGSSDEALGSTLNFDLTAAQITPGTRYSVSLREADSCGGVPTGDNAGAKFPADGTADLAADAPAQPFRVVLVPVRYNADGSGRLPSIDASRVEEFRQHLYSLYPLNQVDVSMGDAMSFNGAVNANGDGWGQLLDACVAERDARNEDPRTYYYCIFDPSSSFGNYCGGGCVAGLGFVPGAQDALRRASIGLGFLDSDAAGTMAHEVGHTLGLPHAPCGGVAGPDPEFPYSGGTIGAWGYDQAAKKLLDPSHTDLMGYCGKTWISDYNYNNIYERYRSVLGAPLLTGAKLDLMSIVVNADASLSFGHTMSLHRLPRGESVAVRYLGADDSVLLDAEGSFAAVTHANGGILHVPAAPAGTARISVAGFGDLAL